MNIEFFSHEQQDEFAYNLFGGKTGGTFIDLACANPIIGNNTYSLEKYCGWTGWCFDIVDVESRDQWSSKRQTKFHQMDATSAEFAVFLTNNVPHDTVVDYISLDIDGASMQALDRILLAGVKFKAMTFEHESFKDVYLRDASRATLEGMGMVRLFEDVVIPQVLNYYPGQTQIFEDWWINPEYFEPELLSIKTSGQDFKHNVEVLKQYKNLPYAGTHACSILWPNEYRIFDSAYQEAEYKEKFRIYFQDK
jgi:hypothetical protein